MKVHALYRGVTPLCGDTRRTAVLWHFDGQAIKARVTCKRCLSRRPVRRAARSQEKK